MLGDVAEPFDQGGDPVDVVHGRDVRDTIVVHDLDDGQTCDMISRTSLLKFIIKIGNVFCLLITTRSCETVVARFRFIGHKTKFYSNKSGS